MSILHIVLLIALAGFVVLYAISPRRPRLAWRYLRITVLSLASLTMLSPFVWLVAAAFKDPELLNEYLFFPPVSEWTDGTLNLKNYETLFQGEASLHGTVYFWQYALNSLFLATMTTVVQLVCSSLTGYALAKYEFRGRRIVTLFVLGSMMIPGLVLLAPIYEMMYHVGFIDSYWGLIIPSAVSAYGVFLFRQAILSVPDEILDAGRIDGCSEFQLYWSLVLPVIRPMTATFCLVSFMASWNAYLFPNILLHSRHKLTMPIVLNLYIEEFNNQMGVFLAGTLLAIVPPALLFVALQREFISGLTSGAVKG